METIILSTIGSYVSAKYKTKPITYLVGEFTKIYEGYLDSPYNKGYNSTIADIEEYLNSLD